MGVMRAMAVILSVAFLFAVAGGLLGYALGTLTPAYYRGVFSGGDDPRFDPVQVGLGLGTTQGILCGVAVGSVLVLAVALAGQRGRAKKAVVSPEAEFAPTTQGPSSLRLVFGVLGIFVGLLAVGLLMFVVGAIFGQDQLYQNSSDAKVAKLSPVLREPQFAGLGVVHSPAAQVELSGTLNSEGAYKELEQRLRFLFGDAEARFMIANVSVAKETGDAAKIGGRERE